MYLPQILFCLIYMISTIRATQECAVCSFITNNCSTSRGHPKYVLFSVGITIYCPGYTPDSKCTNNSITSSLYWSPVDPCESVTLTTTTSLNTTSSRYSVSYSQGISGKSSARFTSAFNSSAMTSFNRYSTTASINKTQKNSMLYIWIIISLTFFSFLLIIILFCYKKKHKSGKLKLKNKTLKEKMLPV